MFCSAMKISKNRSGNFLANLSVNVEFFTSASRTTTRGFASPSLTKVAPKASRVATESVGAYSGGATGLAGAGDKEIGSGLRISTACGRPPHHAAGGWDRSDRDG